MATVRYSALVADARGTIGATTFSRCRSGAVARTRSKPIPHTSDRLHKTNSILSDLNYYWRQSMTDSQRHAWNARAKETVSTNSVGSEFRGTGWNWFLHANLLHRYVEYSIITVPPAQLRIRTPHFTVAYVAPNKISVTDTHGWDPVEGGRVLIQHAHNIPPSRYSWAGPWPEVDWPYASAIDDVPRVLKWIDATHYGTASHFRFRWLVCDGSTSLPWTARVNIPAGG